MQWSAKTGVIQCSIFVSSSFTASALSSGGGDFSFSSSSAGLGELLLTVKIRTRIIKSYRAKADTSVRCNGLTCDFMT